MDGDHALAEGALAAGCRFFAGYPITPSTETAERFAERCPEVGGLFIQMEDEIASITANVGAVWGGQKVMTVTSGPGFSLMMETIGLACMMETPMVLADVQRGGPSTGLPTLTAQQDMMQARWGSHGDYRIIALVPDSPQECFDLAVEAFNLSETYRVPVFIMTDETVGHMHEKVVIPPAEEIRVVERNWYTGPKEDYRPYRFDGKTVAPMVKAGDGYRFHSTGLTHDERGYPTLTPEMNKKLVTHLIEKIESNADKIIRVEEDGLHGAEVVVVSYGITSRIAIRAIQQARKAGIKVGLLRLITVWPFCETKIRNLARKVKAIVVPELNYGQIVLEVERCAAGPVQSDQRQLLRRRCSRSRRNPRRHQGGREMSGADLAPEYTTDDEAFRKENPMAEFLRMDRMPHIWCPGCGIGTVVTCFAEAIKAGGYDMDKIAVVSGIGCTGRVAGYVKFNSFHTTHGRAIPFATGLKLANPDLKVVVISGDGDLTSIGGNHLIHAARRNMDLMVICVNNFTYGMTGGQVTPTTPTDGERLDDARRQLRNAVQPALPGGRLRRNIRGSLDRASRPQHHADLRESAEAQGLLIHRSHRALHHALPAPQQARRRSRRDGILQRGRGYPARRGYARPRYRLPGQDRHGQVRRAAEADLPRRGERSLHEGHRRQLPALRQDAA